MPCSGRVHKGAASATIDSKPMGGCSSCMHDAVSEFIVFAVPQASLYCLSRVSHVCLCQPPPHPHHHQVVCTRELPQPLSAPSPWVVCCWVVCGPCLGTSSCLTTQQCLSSWWDQVRIELTVTVQCSTGKHCSWFIMHCHKAAHAMVQGPILSTSQGFMLHILVCPLLQLSTRLACLRPELDPSYCCCCCCCPSLVW